MIMSKKDNRFIRKFREEYGISAVTEIWVDIETGVNYICHKSGYGMGLTPLLDSSGNPVVSSVYDLEEKL